MRPTLHILGLAHLPSVEKDPVWACAYTQKQVRMSKMMKKLGYRVVFYGVEGTEVDADETVICLSESIRNAVYGPLEDMDSKFFNHNPKDLAYQTFMKNAIDEIKSRLETGDIAINPFGNYYEQIFSPQSKGGIELETGTPFMIEGGIGYTGILNNCHHVFESNTWRAFVYGSANISTIDYYDTVIPNFYDPNHFRWSENKEDYYLMICRLATNKGIFIAKQTVEAIGGKLIVAGQPGELQGRDIESSNVEYIGYINEKEKIDLLSHAKALFCPTIYSPPFEGVSVESLFCGTPVISTDHGCFTETIPEIAGFRCVTLKDFVYAARNVEEIDPGNCREWAESNFTTDICAKKYDSFFGRFSDLYSGGWSQL
jgi:glycosyltransferase involved in cell wall biosynthesis